MNQRSCVLRLLDSVHNFRGRFLTNHIYNCSNNHAFTLHEALLSGVKNRTCIFVPLLVLHIRISNLFTKEVKVL